MHTTSSVAEHHDSDVATGPRGQAHARNGVNIVNLGVVAAEGVTEAEDLGLAVDAVRPHGHRTQAKLAQRRAACGGDGLQHTSEKGNARITSTVLSLSRELMLGAPQRSGQAAMHTCR